MRNELIILLCYVIKFRNWLNLSQNYSYWLGKADLTYIIVAAIIHASVITGGALENVTTFVTSKSINCRSLSVCTMLQSPLEWLVPKNERVAIFTSLLPICCCICSTSILIRGCSSLSCGELCLKQSHSCLELSVLTSQVLHNSFKLYITVMCGYLGSSDKAFAHGTLQIYCHALIVPMIS